MFKIGDKVRLEDTNHVTGTIIEIESEDLINNLYRVDWDEPYKKAGPGKFFEDQLWLIFDGNDILKDLCSK